MRANQICVGTAGVLLTLGCSVGTSEQSDTTGTLAEGLVVESATAKEGLRGSFTLDGRVVHFEAIRGEKNPTGGLDEAPPEYAIDARFTDSDGRSIILSGGGDALMQEGWETQEQDADPESRPLYLAMLPDVVDALSATELPADVSLELASLVELGGSMRDVELVVEPEGQTGHACATGYMHNMTFRNKVAFDIAGNHTAVRLDSWYLNEACTWIYQGWRQSCNHGTCAADASMSDFCNWWSPMRSYQWPVFQRHMAGSSACSTPYSAFSTTGNHNCNDATYFQGYNIRLNTTYSTASGPHNICADSTWHSYSPSCTGARGAAW
jgi:hypothetical protein